MNNEICEKYLIALNESDLGKVLSLFTKDAVVVSPLYGEMAATDFYRDLFSDTKKSETKLLNIFSSINSGESLGLHFHYAWTLQSGSVVEFDVVDVFELSKDRNCFTKLTIIYDTYPIRTEHTDSQKMRSDC